MIWDFLFFLLLGVVFPFPFFFFLFIVFDNYTHLSTLLLLFLFMYNPGIYSPFFHSRATTHSLHSFDLLILPSIHISFVCSVSVYNKPDQLYQVYHPTSSSRVGFSSLFDLHFMDGVYLLPPCFRFLQLCTRPIIPMNEPHTIALLGRLMWCRGICFDYGVLLI